MINPEALAAELNGLLATETRSLTRHLEGAPPYISAGTFRIWRQMQPIAAQSHEHAHRLSDLLATLELPELPRSFDTDVARFHYTALETLLPEIIEEKEHQVVAYRRAIEHAQGEGVVESALKELLEQNTAQLETIRAAQQSLAGDHAATSSH